MPSRHARSHETEAVSALGFAARFGAPFAAVPLASAARARGTLIAITSSAAVLKSAARYAGPIFILKVASRDECPVSLLEIATNCVNDPPWRAASVSRAREPAVYWVMRSPKPNRSSNSRTRIIPPSEVTCDPGPSEFRFSATPTDNAAPSHFLQSNFISIKTAHR